MGWRARRGRYRKALAGRREDHTAPATLLGEQAADEADESTQPLRRIAGHTEALECPLGDRTGVAIEREPLGALLVAESSVGAAALDTDPLLQAVDRGPGKALIPERRDDPLECMIGFNVAAAVCHALHVRLRRRRGVASTR